MLSDHGEGIRACVFLMVACVRACKIKEKGTDDLRRSRHAGTPVGKKSELD